jgi:hypothetical protein
MIKGLIEQDKARFAPPRQAAGMPRRALVAIPPG